MMSSSSSLQISRSDSSPLLFLQNKQSEDFSFAKESSEQKLEITRFLKIHGGRESVKGTDAKI